DYYCSSWESSLIWVF
nr:immunoglobulin light chain junction region [Macaca mulatta]